MQLGIQLPLSAKQLESTYPITNYSQFRNWFNLTRPLRNMGLKVFMPIAKAHIERLKEQGVGYTELIIQPNRFADNSKDILHQIELLREYVLSLEKGEIQIEFVMSIARNRPIEVVEYQAI